MEPAKLKWESKLYTLSENIPTSNIDKVNNALETIHLKIDKIIDEILISPPTLYQFKQLLDQIFHMFPPKATNPLVHRCTLICEDMNMRQANLIDVSIFCISIPKLKTDEEKTDELLASFDALKEDKSFIENSDELIALLNRCETHFWKCCAAKKTVRQQETFKKSCEILIDKIITDKIITTTRSRLIDFYEPVVSILRGMITHIDLQVKVNSIYTMLMMKGDEVLWTYYLRHADLNVISNLWNMKRDIKIIKQILTDDEMCRQNLTNYLKNKLMNRETGDYKFFRHFYIIFFDFYEVFISEAYKYHDIDITNQCRNVIEVECKDGPVFLRWHQVAMLKEHPNYDPQCLTQAQLRLIAKYLFSPQIEEIGELGKEDLICLETFCNLMDIEEPKIYAMRLGLKQQKEFEYDEPCF